MCGLSYAAARVLGAMENDLLPRRDFAYDALRAQGVEFCCARPMPAKTSALCWPSVGAGPGEAMWAPATVNAINGYWW